MKIENGVISEGGRVIGSAMKSLKYGYHPAVKVTVGEQHVGDSQVLFCGQFDDAGHIPGGVHHGCPLAGMIMDQIDNISHRPQFQGMDGKRLVLRHGLILLERCNGHCRKAMHNLINNSSYNCCLKPTSYPTRGKKPLY